MNNISDLAKISKDVLLGDNIEVEENAVVRSGTSIGDTCKIFGGAIIGENCRIGSNCIIKERVIIENNVIIGDNVYIDYDVVVRDNVTISADSMVGCRSILGEYLSDFYTKRKNSIHPLYIGTNALIRSEAIIYGDCEIGNNFQTGHRVTIREKSNIGNNVRIGTLSDIQGECEIQEYVNIHSNVHIGQKSIIKKYAWIFPYVILTNDPNPPSETLKGVTVEEFAIVATGTIVLPGMVIGSESLVGAGSIVTKSVEESMVVVGSPAKVMGSTERIVDEASGKHIYPWKYSFDRGMPWQNIGYEKWSKNNENNV